MTTKDMLQILIKGQTAFKQDLDVLREGYDSLKNGLDSLKQGQDSLKEDVAILREETKDGFKKVHERLDKQGKQLAYLEDDAPTREEYDGLTQRVEKIEKIVSA